MTEPVLDAWQFFTQPSTPEEESAAEVETGRTDFGVLPFAFPGIPSVRCLFSTVATRNLSGTAETTADGVHCVARRKHALARAFGLRQWAELHQVHRDDFVLAPEHLADVNSWADSGPDSCTGESANPAPSGATAFPAVLTEPDQFAPYANADGQHTSQPGVGLVIKTADCQPILLAHKSGKAVAAIHVGWRGNVMNFPATGVARFCAEYGFALHDVLAVRGPSLGPGAAEFINFDREWPQEFAQWFDTDTRCMNLWELTRHQLQSAGIPAGNIFSLDLCTHSLPGLFFSYRRKHTGRQASVIWIA